MHHPKLTVLLVAILAAFSLLSARTLPVSAAPAQQPDGGEERLG